MKLEQAPIKTEIIDERKYFSLPWMRWINQLRNWVISHKHSSSDGAEIDHTTLSNIGVNTHTEIDTKLSYVVPLAHSRLHDIISSSDHTSSATVGSILKADTNGLPVTASASEVEAYHTHSKLVASDGSPDPALNADASGRIGIGTSAQEALLHISGATGRLIIDDTDGNAALLLRNMVENIGVNGNVGVIDWQAIISGVSTIIARIDAIVTTANTQEGQIRFSTANGGTTTVKAVITKDGNLGIGTTTPAVKLQVGNGDSNDVAIRILRKSSPSNIAEWTYNNAMSRIGTVSNDDFGLKTNDITRLSIDTAGTVKTFGGRIISSRDITTGPDTLTASDHAVYVTATSSNIVVNLPAGVTGTEYHISACGIAGKSVIVTPNGTDTLFGYNAPFNLYDYEGITIRFSATKGWR